MRRSVRQQGQARYESGDPSKSEKGTKPVETDRAPPAPRIVGNLPPVPDGADLPLLTPQDAARHLELASQRIEEDYKAHPAARRPPAPGGERAGLVSDVE